MYDIGISGVTGECERCDRKGGNLRIGRRLGGHRRLGTNTFNANTTSSETTMEGCDSLYENPGNAIYKVHHISPQQLNRRPLSHQPLPGSQQLL